MTFTKKDLELAWEWGQSAGAYGESGHGYYEGPLTFIGFYARLDELRKEESR